MEYQEIVTAYNNDSLDISSLKAKLEIAKALKGRSKYRAVNRIEDSVDLIFSIPNTLVISETPEKCKEFENNCDRILNEYYTILINSIEEAQGWDFLKLTATNYSKENFDKISREEKFKVLLELNKKYLHFLEYQKVADIRDCLGKGVELDDKTIKRLEFLNKMLEAFENPRIKTEFYMFDEKFLIALANYKKVKNAKLEDYIKSKEKSIREEYVKLLKFFSVEDLKEISENLVLTSKTLNVSVSNVVQAFSEISETEWEIEYFLSEQDEINQLEIKYQKMKSIEEKEDIQQGKLEEEQEEQEEQTKAKEQENDLNKESNENIQISAVEYTDEFKEQINEIRQVPLAKEAVNYIKLFWFQREEKKSASTLTAKQLSDFLDKIKQMEMETGIRSSLFLITNANEDITRKRLEILQKEAENRGMPRLLECALGGYSSFKIDLDGNIKKISSMSEINRSKIISLMNSYGIEDSYINSDESLYVRYEFSNKKDESITLVSLNRLKKVLQNRIKLSKQPIEILSFIEGNYSGFDVVLNSQIVGIAQISNYYNSKYNIVNKKGFSVYSNSIDEFDFHRMRQISESNIETEKC